MTISTAHDFTSSRGEWILENRALPTDVHAQFDQALQQMKQKGGASSKSTQ